MSVLVATSDGVHGFSAGAHVIALAGHSVDGLTTNDTQRFAIVDGHEVWKLDPSTTWCAVATGDVDLSSIHVHGTQVFVGTYDARLLRLHGDALQPVESFDTAPGRDEWHAVGPSLNVRSMTSTSDAGTLLANVHVGGILRSTDDGATWSPTIAVDDDVHQVRAHPSEPSTVFAAAAVGLCVSVDGGATWSVETDGLPHTYARAVAYDRDAVLVTVSDGPFARRSALYTRPVVGGAIVRVEDGLPDEGFSGNVDTACVDARGGTAALADGGGNVWVRTREAWTRLAESVGDVRAVGIT
ncbi:MAG: sialidase family protein [Acidimicrobiia bacterium]